MASPLFVFDTLDEEGMEAMLGDAPPQQIADTMHKAWVNFATTGDPCWPQFAEESITIKNPPRENYQGVSYHPGSYNSLGIALRGINLLEDILVEAAGEPMVWLVACSDT